MLRLIYYLSLISAVLRELSIVIYLMLMRNCLVLKLNSKVNYLTREYCEALKAASYSQAKAICLDQQRQLLEKYRAEVLYYRFASLEELKEEDC